MDEDLRYNKKAIDMVRAIREGGTTERCHTTPHHGSYSVAEHSWGVATLLAILHPDPPIELILAGMWHDVHERWTGDIPAPIKWKFNDIIKEEMKRIETAIDIGLGIDLNLARNSLTGFALPPEDLKWLKACDMLEFWLWSTDQIALGNQNANEGRSNAEYWFSTHEDKVPDEIRDFMGYYKWSRTSDRDGWKL